MNPPAAPPAPRIRTHGAGAGLAWVQRGLRLFGRQPLMLVVLIGLGVLVLLTISVLPEVGNFLSLVLAPSLSLGALAICRSVDRGQAPGTALYFTAPRDPVARLRLLQLGLYSAIVVMLSSLILSHLPGVPAAGTLADNHAPATIGAPTPAPPAKGNGNPLTPPPDPGMPAGTEAQGAAEPPVSVPVFLATVALMLPYLMTMWFAPVLSGWHGLSVPKALFFSFFACWRNRTAMLVYLITLVGIGVIAMLILGSLIAILNVREGLGLFLLVAPLGFVTAAIAQAANLEMIKDVIDAGDEPGGQAADAAVMRPL